VQRAVLDPGVLVSALISPIGAPAKLLARSREGELELIASPHLLDELEGVLRREKFRSYVDLDGVEAYVDLLRRDAALVADPEGPLPLRSVDPDDDYLIALAYTNDAALISGDKHLLDLANESPIYSPADFLAALGK
jgi:putative PIN family toxin of toxin-antitoxin system